MTTQEAIERIKNLKGKTECALLTADIKEHWLYKDVQGTVEAFNMAIEALERQTLKRIRSIETSDNEVMAYVCSECGKVIDDLDALYCWKCGQRIDFEEE